MVCWILFNILYYKNDVIYFIFIWYIIKLIHTEIHNKIKPILGILFHFEILRITCFAFNLAFNCRPSAFEWMNLVLSRWTTAAPLTIYETFEKFHFRWVFVVGLTLGRRFAINLCGIGPQETRSVLQAPMESKWCYFMRLTSREGFTQADFIKNLVPWITKKHIPLGKYRDLRKKTCTLASEGFICWH